MSEQRLFVVDVERTERARIYVLASDENSVSADLDNGLTDVLEPGDWFSSDDEDVTITQVGSSGGAQVWSGGPDGDWLAPIAPEPTR